jgi:ABC-type transport system involved in multi-copper enzyme maturation permease subunit
MYHIYKVSTSKSDAFGWYGMCAILLGYTLTSFRWIPAGGAVYLILNVTGSAGLLLVSYRKKVWQNVVLNFAWLIIAVVGITLAATKII